MKDWLRDKELVRLRRIVRALEELDVEGRARVLTYLRQRYGLPDRANGGHARAASLSPERRSEIASHVAQTRWGAKP